MENESNILTLPFYQQPKNKNTQKLSRKNTVKRAIVMMTLKISVQAFFVVFILIKTINTILCFTKSKTAFKKDGKVKTRYLKLNYILEKLIRYKEQFGHLFRIIFEKICRQNFECAIFCTKIIPQRNFEMSNRQYYLFFTFDYSGLYFWNSDTSVHNTVIGDGTPKQIKF